MARRFWEAVMPTVPSLTLTIRVVVWTVIVVKAVSVMAWLTP